MLAINYAIRRFSPNKFGRQLFIFLGLQLQSDVATCLMLTIWRFRRMLFDLPTTVACSKNRAWQHGRTTSTEQWRVQKAEPGRMGAWSRDQRRQMPLYRACVMSVEINFTIPNTFHLKFLMNVGRLFSRFKFWKIQQMVLQLVK